MSTSPRDGRAQSRAGRKHGGANWVVFAGGAIAMAVSVAFGRKILDEGPAEGAKEELQVAHAVPFFARGARAGVEDEEAADAPAAPQDSDGSREDESAAFRPSEPAPSGMTPPPGPDSELRSSKTKRPATADPSTPASKCCKQVRRSASITQTTRPNPEDGDGDGGVGVQGIQSRDVIVYEMQAQLSDQDQRIAVHRNHSATLRDCVQAMSKLFEADLEIQRLQRALVACHRATPVVDSDQEFIDYAVSEFHRQWVHPRDAPMHGGESLVEASKATEEVERLRKEKDAADKLAQAKSRQCELLAMRVSTLTTELREVKAAAQGKQRLLEAKEHEYLKMASVVQDLQRKLDIEARDNEWLLMALYAVAGQGGKSSKALQAHHNMDRCP